MEDSIKVDRIELLQCHPKTHPFPLDHPLRSDGPDDNAGTALLKIVFLNGSHRNVWWSYTIAEADDDLHPLVDKFNFNVRERQSISLQLETADRTLRNAKWLPTNLFGHVVTYKNDVVFNVLDVDQGRKPVSSPSLSDGVYLVRPPFHMSPDELEQTRHHLHGVVQKNIRECIVQEGPYSTNWYLLNMLLIALEEPSISVEAAANIGSLFGEYTAELALRKTVSKEQMRGLNAGKESGSDKRRKLRKDSLFRHMKRLMEENPVMSKAEPNLVAHYAQIEAEEEDKSLWSQGAGQLEQYLSEIASEDEYKETFKKLFFRKPRKPDARPRKLPRY